MKEMTRKEKERQARESEIINAAEKLFFERDFNAVSMDEIAKKAEFTKRTLYQYFEHKEDLYFAVILKAFKQLFEYCKEALEQGTTGFDKIRLSFLAYYKFYRDFPEAFRAMNYMGYVQKKGSAKQREWMEFDDIMFTSLARVFEMGKKDGSIRSDIDSQKGAYATVFITTGFFHQLAETGKTFTKHFNLDEEEFTMFALDMLSHALCPPVIKKEE